MSSPGLSQSVAKPDHSWHVLYTNYLARIVRGTITVFTAEEQVHAAMVSEWLELSAPSLEKAWAVEQSFTEQMRAAGLTKALAV